MLYHMEDGQHTQNIQINKVIGENEKYVFYFTEKTQQIFLPILYMYLSPIKCLAHRGKTVFAEWMNTLGVLRKQLYLKGEKWAT